MERNFLPTLYSRSSFIYCVVNTWICAYIYINLFTILSDRRRTYQIRAMCHIWLITLCVVTRHIPYIMDIAHKIRIMHLVSGCSGDDAAKGDFRKVSRRVFHLSQQRRVYIQIWEFVDCSNELINIICLLLFLLIIYVQFGYVHINVYVFEE